jgi:hypothetical protein
MAWARASVSVASSPAPRTSSPAINVVVVGVLVALVADTLGAEEMADMVVGVVVALAAAAGIGVLASRSWTQARRTHRPRFPA